MSATPGPWRVVFGEDAGYDCMSAAYDIRDESGREPFTRLIATLDVANYLPAGTRDYEPAHARHVEAEDNARLIAAAPELLAALVEVSASSELVNAIATDILFNNAPRKLELGQAKLRAALSIELTRAAIRKATEA